MNIFKRFIVNYVANNYLVPLKARLKIYNLMGIKINKVEIRPKCFFNSEFVRIGKNSFVNYFTQFHSGLNESGTIEIGEKCYVAMNVNFCTITHELGDSSQRAGKGYYEPIKVGKGCWVGANSTVLPGITIGEGCIIAAGSVVTKDCEPNGMYAGVPAKRVKELPIGDKLSEAI